MSISVMQNLGAVFGELDKYISGRPDAFIVPVNSQKGVANALGAIEFKIKWGKRHEPQLIMYTLLLAEATGGSALVLGSDLHSRGAVCFYNPATKQMTLISLPTCTETWIMYRLIVWGLDVGATVDTIMMVCR